MIFADGDLLGGFLCYRRSDGFHTCCRLFYDSTITGMFPILQMTKDAQLLFLANFAPKCSSPYLFPTVGGVGHLNC